MYEMYGWACSGWDFFSLAFSGSDFYCLLSLSELIMNNWSSTIYLITNIVWESQPLIQVLTAGLQYPLNAASWDPVFILHHLSVTKPETDMFKSDNLKSFLAIIWTYKLDILGGGGVQGQGKGQRLMSIIWLATCQSRIYPPMPLGSKMLSC